MQFSVYHFNSKFMRFIRVFFFESLMKASSDPSNLYKEILLQAIEPETTMIIWDYTIALRYGKKTQNNLCIGKVKAKYVLEAVSTWRQTE